MKVESKKDMRLRNVASPNIADALCISEYFFTPMAGRIIDRGKVSPPTKKLEYTFRNYIDGNKITKPTNPRNIFTRNWFN